MADVMQGRGHGGDGAEDPPSPPPGGFGRGHHEQDVVPRRKTRGKAKNIKLTQAVARNKGPLKMSFDTDATYTPVGILNDWFTRDLGIYMQANIPFDKTSWKYVSAAEKNALNEHIRELFDMDEIAKSQDGEQMMAGLEAAKYKRYRDRKHDAKLHFEMVGGEADVARAKENPPENMPNENWLKAIDFFTSAAHKKRSEANKSVRQKQKYVNRGGTSTYASFCHKNDKSRLEAFYNAHTLKDGTFDSELAEQQYNELKAMFESEKEPYSEDEFVESGASHQNNLEVFDAVLGERRGHRRGIGRKPSSCTSSSVVGPRGQEETRPTFTPAQIESLFEDPIFKERIDQLVASKMASKKGEQDNDTTEEE